MVTMITYGHIGHGWSHRLELVLLVTVGHISDRCSHLSQVVTLVIGGHIGHRWSHWSLTNGDFGKRPTSPHTDID